MTVIRPVDDDRPTSPFLTPDGKRRYVGDHAVLDAIEAGEKVLRASTLWIDQCVDNGGDDRQRTRFALDEHNRVYVDGNPVPEGYKDLG